MLKRPTFSIGKNYHTAVEIGKSSLKVAQAEVFRGATVISGLITRDVFGFSDEEISKALADIISTRNIRAKSLTVLISRDRAMVRYTRLPATKAEEIDRMISYEAARQIPYSQEEVISDYEIIGTDSEGYSEIMLAIIHKKEMARINNILGSIEKRKLKVRLSSEAIATWLKIVAKEELGKKTLCLLDVDSDSTEIAIISDGRLEFGRVASIGAVSISQKEGDVEFWNQRLVDEIKRSIAMYIKEKGKEASPVSEFLVVGAGSVIESLSLLIRNRMDTPCRSLNVLSTLPMKDGALPDEGISPDSSICAVCGSLFIAEGLNLLPQELRREQRLKVKTRKVVTAAISVVTGFILLFAIVSIRLYQKEQLLNSLNNMLKQIEPVTEATEDKLKKLRLIKQQLSEGSSSLDAIYHLYRLIPAKIFLVDFDYEDKDRAVRFRGTAGRMSDVFNLATILDKSDRFSSVQTSSVSKRQTRQDEVVDFQIRCIFIPKE